MNLSNETAEQLKDAGFPQDWSKVQQFYFGAELYTVGDVGKLTPWPAREDGSGFHTASDGGCGCCSSQIGGSPLEYTYVPTLSELIEACGEKHYIVKHSPVDVNPRRDETITTKDTGARVMEYRNFCLFGYPDATKWIAGFGLEGQVYDLKGEGSTPEEAVANLWLALNTVSLKT